jgi:hypothetical protein
MVPYPIYFIINLINQFFVHSLKEKFVPKPNMPPNLNISKIEKLLELNNVENLLVDRRTLLASNEFDSIKIKGFIIDYQFYHCEPFFNKDEEDKDYKNFSLVKSKTIVMKINPDILQGLIKLRKVSMF